MADRADTAQSPSGTPEQLLGRYLAGDDEAFGLLVARYEDRLYAFLARMTGDAHLAEDIFQQTFVKVAKNAAAFDGRASFTTWLYRIARNAALDEFRRRARRHEGTGMQSNSDIDMADASRRPPLDALMEEELAERIRAVLETLPKEQREAFLLKEECELNFDEIGVILDCGKETAKSRFRLAVGKIRAALGVGAGA